MWVMVGWEIVNDDFFVPPLPDFFIFSRQKNSKDSKRSLNEYFMCAKMSNGLFYDTEAMLRKRIFLCLSSLRQFCKNRGCVPGKGEFGAPDRGEFCEE